MPATDLTRGLDGQSQSAPPEHCALVTPADADLAHVTRAISIGTAGTLVVTMLGGETVTIPANALAVGVQHAMRVTRIAAASTADEIVAWF